MGRTSQDGASAEHLDVAASGIPSAAVCIGVSGLLFVVTLSVYLAGAPTFTNDFWFHLKMGEVYWLEGLWPDADPMLHTALPEAPIQHEWLFGVVCYGLERLTGFFGIRIAHALAVLSTLWLGFTIARRACSDVLVACLIASAFGILAWTRLFQVRPDLLSIPATLFTYRLLISSHRVPSWREIALFSLVMIVWANAHSLFAFAPLLLFAAWLGLGVRALMEWWLLSAEDRRAALSLTGWVALAVAGACGLAVLVSLLNPRGIEQHLTFLTSSRDSAIWAVKDEWSHFDPFVASNNPGTVSPLLWGMTNAVIVVFIATGIAGLWATLRRRARTLEIFDPVAFGLGLASIVAILVSVRFLWMAIFPMLFVGRALARSGVRVADRGIVSWALALATVFVGVQFYRVGGYQTVARKLPESVSEYLTTPYLSRKFYVEGVRFLRDTGVEGRLFNTYGMGGFLGYWLSPRLSTFIDSRTEHYPPEIIAEYSRITRMSELGGRSTYLDILERREVDFFFGVGMPVGLVSRAGGSTTAHLEGIPGWIEVSRSLHHGIYLRDHPRNAENFDKIARYYAAHSIPFDRRRGFDAASAIDANSEWALAHDLMTPAQAERIALRASEDPAERARALDALAWVYTLGGSYSAALGTERELERVQVASKHAQRRRVLAAMKRDQPGVATQAAAALLRIDPGGPDSLIFQQLATAFAELSAMTAGRMRVDARAVALGRVTQRLPLLSPFEAAMLERAMPGEPRVDSKR